MHFVHKGKGTVQCVYHTCHRHLFATAAIAVEKHYSKDIAQS